MDTPLNCPDILNVILQYANNEKTLIVCKLWMSVVASNCMVCLDCNKVVKMYGRDLWIYEEEGKICHTFYGTIETYKKLKKMLYLNYRCLANIKRQSVGLCLYTINLQSQGFKYVRHQTPEICSAAIKHNPDLLEYVKDQTEEIIVQAVTQRLSTIKFVRNQTEELCMKAIEYDPKSFKYFDKKPPKLCLEAIKKDASLIEFIPEGQTEEFYLQAVEINSDVFPLISNKFMTHAVCLAAAKKNGMMIRYMPNVIKTEDICIEAIRQNVEVFSWSIRTANTCLEAVKKDGMKLRMVPPETQTEDICIEAIRQNVNSYQYIRFPTEKIWIEVIKIDKNAFMKLDSENITTKICEIVFGEECDLFI